MERRHHRVYAADRRRALTCWGVPVATLLGIAASAPAQFNYQLFGMPDFDQRRPLPCDGAAHCCPTSSVNLMGYVSNHGFPSIMDGPRTWQLQEHFDDVTFEINSMGIYMDTDPQCAGTAGGWASGLTSYVNVQAPGVFTITGRYAAAEYNYVTPFWMYVKLLGGGLVTFSYGRFAQLPNQAYERQSGHAVTLTGLVNADTSLVTYKYRNPGGDSVLPTQSIFATDSYNAAASTITTGGQALTMWELLTSSNDGRRRFIDGWLGIDTTFVLTPTTPGVLLQLKPVRLTSDPTPSTTSTNPPAGTTIRSAVLHPELSRAFLITSPTSAGQPQLWRYTRHDRALVPLLTLTSADAPMCTSRQGDLFIGLGTSLRRYNADGVPQQLGAYTPSAPATALAYDDAADRVVALLPSTRRLLVLPRTLGSGVEKPLPSAVLLGTSATIAIAPAHLRFDGEYVITSVRHVYRLRTDTATGGLLLADDISLPGINALSALVMDSGHLLVSDGSTLTELSRTSAGWVRSPSSSFTGLACGPQFDVSRSRSNFDPTFHSAPAWSNTVDPVSSPGLPDPGCNADFNHDGDIGTDQDIEAFFACLAGHCCRACDTADFNGDGDTGTDQDIESFFRVLAGGGC